MLHHLFIHRFIEKVLLGGCVCGGAFMGLLSAIGILFCYNESTVSEVCFWLGWVLFL